MKVALFIGLIAVLIGVAFVSPPVLSKLPKPTSVSCTATHSPDTEVPPTDVPTNVPPTSVPPTNVPPKITRTAKPKSKHKDTSNNDVVSTAPPASVAQSGVVQAEQIGWLDIGKQRLNVYATTLPFSGAGKVGQVFIFHELQSTWISPKKGMQVVFTDLNGGAQTWVIGDMQVVDYGAPLTTNQPELWSCVSDGSGWIGLGVWELNEQ